MPNVLKRNVSASPSQCCSKSPTESLNFLSDDFVDKPIEQLRSHPA